MADDTALLVLGSLYGQRWLDRDVAEQAFVSPDGDRRTGPLVSGDDMTEVDPFEVAAWRMAVGRLASEDLPELATEALVRGLDSPSLRVLAGQAPSDVRDSADLFRAALSELGIELPDSEIVEWRLARRIAAEIVAGTLSAGRGANDLCITYHQVRDNGDLSIFVGLALMLEDSPDDLEMIEADIVAAAQELLARSEPRCWITLMAAREGSSLTQWRGFAQIEIDPATLDLTDELRSDLARWDTIFVTAVSDWPARGGFESERDAEDFVSAGQQLVARLQFELGTGYHVEYMSEPIRPPGAMLRRRSPVSMMRAVVSRLARMRRRWH